MNLQEAVRKRFRRLGRHDNLPWGLVKSSRDGLADIFCDLGFTEGVEVGTRAGAYSKVLCKKNPNLHLTCVDPWMAYSRLKQDRQDAFFREAVENLKDHNVTILRKTSMDGLNKFKDGSLDFVYIDGNHEFDFACQDIICWSHKVKKGGVIAVHDYYHFYRAGVVQAVDAYTSAHKIDPWYVTREREPTAYWEKP